MYLPHRELLSLPSQPIFGMFNPITTIGRSIVSPLTFSRILCNFTLLFSAAWALFSQFSLSDFGPHAFTTRVRHVFTKSIAYKPRHASRSVKGESRRHHTQDHWEKRRRLSSEVSQKNEDS